MRLFNPMKTIRSEISVGLFIPILFLIKRYFDYPGFFCLVPLVLPALLLLNIFIGFSISRRNLEKWVKVINLLLLFGIIISALILRKEIEALPEILKYRSNKEEFAELVDFALEHAGSCSVASTICYETLPLTDQGWSNTDTLGLTVSLDKGLTMIVLYNRPNTYFTYLPYINDPSAIHGIGPYNVNCIHKLDTHWFVCEIAIS